MHWSAAEWEAVAKAVIAIISAGSAAFVTVMVQLRALHSTSKDTNQIVNGRFERMLAERKEMLEQIGRLKESLDALQKPEAAAVGAQPGGSEGAGKGKSRRVRSGKQGVAAAEDGEENEQ